MWFVAYWQDPQRGPVQVESVSINGEDEDTSLDCSSDVKRN